MTAVLPRTVHQFGLPVFKLHIYALQQWRQLVVEATAAVAVAANTTVVAVNTAVVAANTAVVAVGGS